MKVALFGGTFDPIHAGHLAAAQAAQSAFGLDRIYFTPASLPPHKRNRPLTSFAHRYAMVSLACAGAAAFLPSLLESPEESGGQPNYSLTTVRKLEAALAPQDRLYFLVGADAFLDLPHWHEWVALLESCDFIIASRPGFPIAEIAKIVPPELRAGPATGTTLPLRRTALHLLTTVKAEVSSSAIRRLAAEGRSLCGLVPEAVADYIEKLGLFLHENQTEGDVPAA